MTKAVATAIALKVNTRPFRSSTQAVNGGGTLRLQLRKGHPYTGQVFGLLERARSDTQLLWSTGYAYVARARAEY